MVKFTWVQGLSQYEKDQEKNRQIVQSTAKKPTASTGTTQKAPSLLEQATGGNTDSRFSSPGTQSLLSSADKMAEAVKNAFQQTQGQQMNEFIRDYNSAPDNPFLIGRTVDGTTSIRKKIDYDAQIKAAEQELSAARKGAPFVRNSWSTQQPVTTTRTTEEIKQEIAGLKADQASAVEQYYQLENELQRYNLSRDQGTGQTYDSARTLQKDLEALDRAIQLYNNADPMETEDPFVVAKDVMEKYGITAQDFANASMYGDLKISNIRGQMEKELENLRKGLATAGYQFDRMSQYQDTQEKAKQYQQESEARQKWAKEHPIVSSISSVLRSPLQGVEFLELAAESIGNDPKDLKNYVPPNVYDMVNTNAVNQIRGVVSDDIQTNWGNVASFLYQTGMSVADSVGLVSTVGPAATMFMGGAAASSTAADIIQRGGTSNQAIWGGLAAGAAEAVFEKFSVDRLLSIKDVNSVKSLVKEVAKQSGVEASEEMLTEISNIISDSVIMQGNSNYARAVDAYKSSGMSQKEAEKKAFLDNVGQVVLAGVGGALSGGIMGGAVRGLNYFSTNGNQTGPSSPNIQTATETPMETQQGGSVQTVQPASILEKAAAEFNQRGAVSNNTATAILNDPAAVADLQQNGLTLTDGMTQAQRRAAVKETVARMQSPDETFSPGAQAVLDVLNGRQETAQAPADTATAYQPPEAVQTVLDVLDGQKNSANSLPGDAAKAVPQMHVQDVRNGAFGESLGDVGGGHRRSSNGASSDSGIEPPTRTSSANLQSVQPVNISDSISMDSVPQAGVENNANFAQIPNGNTVQNTQSAYNGVRFIDAFVDFTGENPTWDDITSYAREHGIRHLKDVQAAIHSGMISQRKNKTYFVTKLGDEARYFNYDASNIPEQDTDLSMDAMDQAAQPGETTSVGAAESGFDPFSQLQEQSSAFHPINEKAASVAQEQFGRAPIEVPTENQYGNRISKTAATALNSRNTSNTMASLIEDQIVKGDLSYAVLPNDVVQQRAQDRIKSVGFPDALSQYYRNIDRGGTAAVDNNALGLALYNEAVAAGDDVTAYNILDTLQQNTRDYARAVQVISLMNQLTPAGKLYMVEKTVRNMNAADQSRNNQRNVESAAKSVGKSVSAAVMDENIPAQEWWMEAADRLTASVDRQQQAPGRKTTMQEILADLKRFAYQTAGERVQRTGDAKTDFDRIKDYLENRDFYDDVWQDAQQLLEEKYEGNEDAIAQYRNWLNSTVTNSINNSLKGKAKPKGNLDQLRAAIASGGFSDAAIRDGLNTYLFGEKKYKVSPELAQAYLEAETDQQRDNILDQIKQDIADQIPSTFMERFTALRYLHMLGNLKTQVKNVVGNAVMQGARMGKNAIATGIESMVDNGSRLFGGDGLQRSKSFYLDKDLFFSAWTDARNVRDILLGAGKFSDRSAINKEIQDKRTIFKSNAKWGTQEDSSTTVKFIRKLYDAGWRFQEARRKIVSSAMDKGDLFFSYTTYADALSSYLHANGVSGRQLADGAVDADLLDKARAYAITEAQKATFRDHNAFSDMVASIGFKNADTLPKKAANVVLEGTLPFKRTPANVFMRVAEYSPYSIVKSAIDGVKKKRGSSDITGAEIIDELAAGLTGTGLLGLGAGLFLSGILRGGDDEDLEQQYFDELQGHQSYSLEIDGKSYTIDWSAPVSVPLFVGAELAKYGSSEGLSFDSIMKIGKQMTAPIIQMSMLQGINDAFSSVSYSDDGAMQFVLNAAIDYINQGLTSTLGGQIERTAEDARMTTFTDAGTQTGRSLQQALGGALAKVPGFDYNQIPFVDAWGRVEENGNKLLTGLENFLSPGYGSTVETTPVDEIIQAVYDETGNKSVLPDRITDRSITVDGVEHKLTAEQYNDRQITYGQTRRSILEAAYNSGALQNMTPKEQEQFMVNAKELAAEVAKQELLQSMGLEYTPSKAMQTADRGVGLENYAAFDAIYSVMDKEDTENQVSDSATAIMAIEKAGIADKDTAAALWSSKNSNTRAAKNPYSGAMGQSGLTVDEIVDIISKADSIENQYQESADQKKAFIEYLDGLDLSPKEYNAAMFQADYQKSYNYDTMTDKQKTVWDNWGSSQYDMDEFLKLYRIMSGEDTKAEAIDALYQELGDQYRADRFYSQAKKKWD
ncbi:hypothetical protein ACTQ33_01020 [Candidatus Avoscillospira sp. LCP25S3_F1]|uniref:hypothetical protein n=1 Tax=Candidatus Avoscillospira sp. LCP25S3_F1 TaxID=3438825 RepID=UPI003F8EDC38